MTWYYSASERAFFSTDLMTTGSMPSDKVAVTDTVYKQLMADQVAGKLIRPGSGNAPESANQNLSAASRFGDVSFGKVTCTSLDLNGNADISGTLVVTGATTLKGALAAQAGIATTTITATGTSTFAAVNATNIKASGTLTVNGSSTLKALSATNVTASGTLNVSGNSTLKALSATTITASSTLAVTGATTLTGKLTANGGINTKALVATSLDLNGDADISGKTVMTGLLTANGGVTTKALTATSLDLNGAGDISGNLKVGGLLDVTGNLSVDGYVIAKDTITTNSNNGFRLFDKRNDALEKPSSDLQAWPVRMIDVNGNTLAMLKYVRKTSGESQWILADVAYSKGSEGSNQQNWAQVTLGHRSNGDAFLSTGVPSEFTGGLTVSGGDLTSSGSVSFTNGLTVTGKGNFDSIDVTNDAIVRRNLMLLADSGGHITRQLKSITKGTNPSSGVYIGHFIYGSGATNSSGNRLCGNEYSVGTAGNATYTFYCYDFRAGKTDSASLRLGYNADHEPYCNISASAGINMTGQLNANAGLRVAGGIQVNSGNVVCGSGNFQTGSTCGIDIYDKTIDGTKAPSSSQQRWLARVLDVNEKTVGMLKFNQGTDGSQNIQIVSVLNSSDGSQKMNAISVGHDSSGKAFAVSTTPEDSSNGDNIATTKWVRAYNWDASRGQIVHTVNNETIAGVKTFSSPINSSANPLITSTPWSSVGIADTSRSATTNKMLVQAVDKNSKRFVGLEVTAGDDGSRQFAFNGRKRDDSGWVVFLRCIEYADGSHNLTAGQHPPAGDSSLKLATTGWVVSQLSTSGEETHICNLDQARVFKRSGNHICGSVHVQMFRSLDTTGTHTDDYGIYVGSSRVATVTVIFQANKGGSSGHGRSIDIQLSGSFEVSANVPAGSQITLRRDTSNIPGDMRHAFAHVTVSNA